MRAVQLFLFLILNVAVVQPDRAATPVASTGSAGTARDKTSELKSDDADAYALRCAAEVDKGDFDGAIADGTKAIELNP